MNHPFKAGNYRHLYRDTARIKWFVLITAAIISVASIIYTNEIVSTLSDREKRFIELYARSIEYAANENSQDLTFIAEEIIIPNNSIPVIWTDGANRPISYRNLRIDSTKLSDAEVMESLRKEVNRMRNEHGSIQITFRNERGEIYDYQYLYYTNSLLLTQLRYYPYVQLSIIAIFGILAYLAFSYSRTAEQNRVWVGLAKETAHQLGTPISSLMAWMEYLKTIPELAEKDIGHELEKDIKRLEMVTARFSSIGSVPILNSEDLPEAIRSTVNYLQRRISSKIKIHVESKPSDIRARINRPLFEWVIENLIKNAVDAMNGSGRIDVTIGKGVKDEVVVDLSDNGKGIPKSKTKDIFKPGYTTKSRGWGLGLTLVKRIVENYHQGKIYVKSTEPGKGVTFRIILKM